MAGPGTEAAVVNVVITGCDLPGWRLARELLATGPLEVAGGGARPLSRVTLIGRAPVPPDVAAGQRGAVIGGDLAAMLDPATEPDALDGGRGDLLSRCGGRRECEADFELSTRTNLRATEALMESCYSAAGTGPAGGVRRAGVFRPAVHGPPATRSR